jgi:Beta-lactamase
VHAKGYGMANLEHAIPKTTKTVFEIGSVSKQFTGMAIADFQRDAAGPSGRVHREYVARSPAAVHEAIESLSGGMMAQA